MSIARLGEAIEKPSVTQIMAAYPTKRAFDDAVKQGKIKPTTEAGVVANIYNRIVNEALAQEVQTETTVFQDNTQSAPQMGLAAAQQMQGQPAGPGLDQIPVPEQMFNQPQGMAGGGIVAFQAGGLSMDRALAMMNLEERANYRLTGQLPARLQALMQPTATDAETAKFSRQGTGVPSSSAGLAAQGFTPPAAPPRAASNLPSTAQAAVQQAAVQQGTTPLGVEEEFNQDFAMIQRVLGEDPTRARLKALYEKQEKEAEANARTDNAMRLIEAGLAVAGGTSPYAGANFALAAPAVRGAGEDTRARRKEATERAKGMAELEGMTRKEKADILTQTMTRRREEKKIKEDREFREKLVRLEASLKPEDFNRYAARILEKGTPEQKAAVEKLIARNRGSETFTYEDAAKLVDDRIAKDSLLIKRIQDREKAAGRPVPDEDTVRRRLIEQERRAAGAGTSVANSDLLRRADAIIGSQ
jgi:hypothetical protein